MSNYNLAVLERKREELKCPICLELLDQPVVLPECGHKYCKPCVLRIVNAYTGGPKAVCPCCRGTFTLEEAQNLQVDRRIRSQVQDLKAQIEKSALYCRDHTTPITLMCQTCSKKVCHMCITGNYGGKHTGHTTVPLAQDSNRKEGHIQLFVKSINGPSFPLFVFPKDSVDSLRKKVAEESNSDAEIVMLYGGKTLENGKTLEQCGVKDNSNIQVVTRFRGGFQE